MKVYVVPSLLHVFEDKVTTLVSNPGDAQVICYLIDDNFDEQNQQYIDLKSLVSSSAVRFVVIVEKNPDRNRIPIDLNYDCCYNIRNKNKLEELIGKLNNEEWASAPKKIIRAQKTRELLEIEKKRIEDESKKLAEIKEAQEENLRREKGKLLEEKYNMERRLAEERKELEDEKKNEETWILNEKLRLAASSSQGESCAVCMERPISVTMKPCKHACCCYECAIKLIGGPCPICRRIITKVKPVFISGHS